MFDPTQAPLIPETLLKKRRSLEELVYKRSTTVQLQNKKRKVRGEDIKIKRPEQFVTEKRTKIGSQQKMERRQKNVLRKTRGQYIPKKDEKSSVGLAIRIHQGRHASKVIKQQLQELGLNDKYDAVFVKLDKEGIGK